MCLRGSRVATRSRGRGKVGKGEFRGRRGRSGAKLVSLETFFLTWMSWLGDEGGKRRVKKRVGEGIAYEVGADIVLDWVVLDKGCQRWLFVEVVAKLIEAEAQVDDC